MPAARLKLSAAAGVLSLSRAFRAPAPSSEGAIEQGAIPENLPLTRKVARRSRDGRREKPKDWNRFPTKRKNLRIRRRCAHRAPVLPVPYSRTSLRNTRRGRCPHRPAAGTLILLQITSIRALRRGGGTSGGRPLQAEAGNAHPCRGRRPRRPAVGTIDSASGIRGAMHPQGVCRIRKAAKPPTAALRALRPAQDLGLGAMVPIKIRKNQQRRDFLRGC